MSDSIMLYKDEFREAVVTVWEKSVRATHHFLKLDDIVYYKSIVSALNFNDFTVYCYLKDDEVIGFLGVSERKIEMLFLDPEFRGKGIGTQLMEFALKNLNVIEVDVNEGNTNATKFYQKFGFITYDRTPTDSEGKPYPILKMKLEI